MERILSLCDQLLNGVEESRAIERKAEEVRNANFELEKNLLNRDISDLNTQIGISTPTPHLRLIVGPNPPIRG